MQFAAQAVAAAEIPGREIPSELDEPSGPASQGSHLTLDLSLNCERTKKMVAVAS